MRIILPVVLLFFLFLFGCAMLGSWRAIPPPGGCDQCHQKPINNDWSVTVTAAQINDETATPAWQQPSSVLPAEPSPLEQQKVTEQRCFRCHKGPDKAHTQYKASYHH